jgi:hypothetical protein
MEQFLWPQEERGGDVCTEIGHCHLGGKRLEKLEVL